MEWIFSLFLLVDSSSARAIVPIDAKITHPCYMKVIIELSVLFFFLFCSSDVQKLKAIATILILSGLRYKEYWKFILIIINALFRL